MENVACLVALVVCGVGVIHAQQPPVSGERGTVCGRVVSVTCKGTNPPNISVVLDRVLVSVDVRLDDRHDARATATGLLFRQVCASGTLKEKGTPFKAPAFEVASINDITAHPDDPPQDWVHSGVYRTCDPGVELPKVKSDSRPRYTVEALSAGVQGAVWVDAVVEVDGRVGDTRVIRSLDRGLDAEAVNAAKRWRFIPGTKDGQAAPILVTIELTFRIKADRPRP